MIVYVARPIDADNIKLLLKNNGINNVRTFTGLTSSSKRKSLINEWVNDKFEIMIATSAFGVGVDKSDVRTVIHTYIPQNANSYYQELVEEVVTDYHVSVLCACIPEDTNNGT